MYMLDGGSVSSSGAIGRDEWTPAIEDLFAKASAAAKAKGWNGIAFSLPQYSEEQYAVNGARNVTFHLMTDKMRPLLISDRPLNALTYFLLP
ncbi:hypothetical protein [Paraburkholderia diazotrophica]|uniref:hypothetical protein n=1 Tax=Paraburkholderia diazotrophica TaxID=667676 RepID=UPI00115F9C41|nr:hypothetical protein [Paraburkholderia diazotrophica]